MTGLLWLRNGDALESNGLILMLSQTVFVIKPSGGAVVRCCGTAHRSSQVLQLASINQPDHLPHQHPSSYISQPAHPTPDSGFAFSFCLFYLSALPFALSNGSFGCYSFFCCALRHFGLCPRLMLQHNPHWWQARSCLALRVRLNDF